jgi:hypothetical protein
MKKIITYPNLNNDIVNEHVAANIPFIVNDAFHNQKIASIKNVEIFQKNFGQLIVPVKAEYSNAIFFSKNYNLIRNKCEHLSVQHYLQKSNFCKDKKIIHCRTLPKLQDYISFPEFKANDNNDNNISHMFLSTKEGYAHLHMDRDQRQVLLYQVFGKKEIVIIEPHDGYKLFPISNMSGVFVEKFSEKEKYNFLSYANAYHAVLSPGDLIYIPALHWHYLKYNDTALSINYRYGRNDYNKFLGDNLFPNKYLQMVSINYLNNKPAEEYRNYFNTIVNQFEYVKEGSEKYDAIFSILKNICKENYPELTTDHQVPINEKLEKDLFLSGMHKDPFK